MHKKLRENFQNERKSSRKRNFLLSAKKLNLGAKSTFAVSGLHRLAPEAPWLVFYAEHSRLPKALCPKVPRRGAVSRKRNLVQ
ncbi:MAG TPA: hypothetical protein DEB39_17055 [Planctomycetaceae bacterium]|nr:hypothetical protein [Planctomycetaceae bacterium]